MISQIIINKKSGQMGVALLYTISYNLNTVIKDVKFELNDIIILLCTKNNYKGRRHMILLSIIGDIFVNKAVYSIYDIKFTSDFVLNVQSIPSYKS